MAKRSDARPGRSGHDPKGAEDPAYILYDELLRARDRLAGLPPLTAADLAPVAHGLHEVIWFFLRPPAAAMQALRLSERLKADLARAARDRSADLYTTIVAALALKLANKNKRQTAQSIVADIQDGLDSLTFDFRATKAATLERLGQVKAHLEDRIAHVKGTRRKTFRFNASPEKYRDRAKKSETPVQFLQRVYGADLQRGLTQADIRDADPAFYNVLHVWCSRHGKRMANLVPASRTRPR